MAWLRGGGEDETAAIVESAGLLEDRGGLGAERDAVFGFGLSTVAGDALADPPGGLGFRRPEGLEYTEHVGLLDAVHGYVAQGGEGVALEGAQPRGGDRRW